MLGSQPAEDVGGSGSGEGNTLQQKGAWPVTELSASWRCEMEPEKYTKT